MQSSITLEEADVQDLALLIEVFTCRYGSCHKEMDLLAKRFNVPIGATFLEKSIAISSRTYSFLQHINGTSKLLEVIDYILQKGFGSHRPDIDVYSKILMKYGFIITSENGSFKLAPIPSGLLEKERRKMVSWIEQHANSKVLSHLRDARNNLGKGRFDYVLDDCRKALEALTTGTVSFSDSLTELINKNVILQGSRQRKMDAELLRSVYGFDSTLGSHTSAKRPKPNIEQATLGLHNTESCIYFLLKRLVAASKKGTKLQNWA